MISPNLDNKFRNLFFTPNKIISDDRYVSTPNVQMEINFESPYYANCKINLFLIFYFIFFNFHLVIQGLKHDEKSSSFKRIKINNFPQEIMGRSINFEGEGLEYVYKNKQSDFGNNMNNNLSMYNIHKSHSQFTNIHPNPNNSHNNLLIDYNNYSHVNIHNQNKLFKKCKINFSSESENSIDSCEQEDQDEVKIKRNARMKGKSKFNIDLLMNISYFL